MYYPESRIIIILNDSLVIEQSNERLFHETGLLTIGPRFGGAIDDAARYFKDAYDRVSYHDHNDEHQRCVTAARIYYFLFFSLNNSTSSLCFYRISHLMSL